MPTRGIEGVDGLERVATDRARGLLSGQVGLVRRTAPALITGIAYYATAQLSLRLALVGENVTPLWPPTGIAVAALFIAGRGVWPAILVAALAVNLPISDEWWAAAMTAVGNTLAPLAALVLLERAGFDRMLARLVDAVTIVWTALLAMTISASIGTIALLAQGTIERSEAVAAWSVWWAGDAMGVLVVAPFLFAAPAVWRELAHGWTRRLEIVAHVLVVTVVAVIVLREPVNLLFLILVPVGITAWRLAQAGATPSALIVSSLASFCAARSIGPFEGPLLERMLTLQSFNVSVALSSFVFAALVAERAAQRADLEASAHQLEQRVRHRTAELQATNEELVHEVNERVEAEAALRMSERRLAEAQAVARVGSWEWDLVTGAITWSAQMYEIHGVDPSDTDISFERVVGLIAERDRPRVRRNVEESLAQGRRHVPSVEYHVERSDGTTVTVLGTGRLIFDGGTPVRMVGTVQDQTERVEREREHRIAVTLQRAMIPRDLPLVPGLELWAHYAPAESDLLAGGDWYDAIPLSNDRLAVVIGDVAGHGVDAASVMAQLRMGVRASLVVGEEPGDVMDAVNRVLCELDTSRMATMLLAIVDGGAGRLDLACAGHPTPLLIDGDGARYLETDVGPPLGVVPDHAYRTTRHPFSRGSTLVLFTDGLVDQRGRDIDEALDAALRIANEDAAEPVSDVGERLVLELSPAEPDDDIAVLCVKAPIGSVRRFRSELHADPSELAGLRAGLRAWLHDRGLDPDSVDDLVLACNEAVTNAIEHARPADGVVVVEGDVVGRSVRLVIVDTGTWREPRATTKGRGLEMIRALSDDLRISTGPHGTRVSIGRRLDPVP